MQNCALARELLLRSFPLLEAVELVEISVQNVLIYISQLVGFGLLEKYVDFASRLFNRVRSYSITTLDQ